MYTDYMATLVLETRQMRQRLIDQGYEADQADAVVDVVIEATQNLVTNDDLKAALELQEAHLKTHTWVVAATQAGIVIAAIALIFGL